VQSWVKDQGPQYEILHSSIFFPYAVKRSTALPAEEIADLKSIPQGAAKYSLVGRSVLKRCESALEEVFKAPR
jgi:hypothetical protein